jgi:hypothetical protein
MIYIAVLFMCVATQCEVLYSGVQFNKKETCLYVIQMEEIKHKAEYDIFESRCIEVKINSI